jgi:hypothetical protein
MSLTSLECQVSELVDIDTCPRPSTAGDPGARDGRVRTQTAFAFDEWSLRLLRDLQPEPMAAADATAADPEPAARCTPSMRAALDVEAQGAAARRG